MGREVLRLFGCHTKVPRGLERFNLLIFGLRHKIGCRGFIGSAATDFLPKLPAWIDSCLPAVPNSVPDGMDTSCRSGQNATSLHFI